MICKINRTPKGIKEYPLHTHKNYEIMLYLDGKGCMKTDTRKIPFERGTIIVVPPDTKHGSVSENGFDNISVEGDFAGYFSFDTVNAFSDNDSREGTTLAKLLYKNRFTNDAYIDSLCKAYVCFLMRRFELDCTPRGIVREIILKISQRFSDSELNLASLLSESGYSEDYMRACFKKVTQKTPNGFLTDIRIKHACFLIDIYKNATPLTEIAEKCGYTDYTYFSKKFKSVMGMSPRKYLSR